MAPLEVCSWRASSPPTARGRRTRARRDRETDIARLRPTRVAFVAFDELFDLGVLGVELRGADGIDAGAPQLAQGLSRPRAAHEASRQCVGTASTPRCELRCLRRSLTSLARPWRSRTISFAACAARHAERLPSAAFSEATDAPPWPSNHLKPRARAPGFRHGRSTCVEINQCVGCTR